MEILIVSTLRVVRLKQGKICQAFSLAAIGAQYIVTPLLFFLSLILRRGHALPKLPGKHTGPNPSFWFNSVLHWESICRTEGDLILGGKYTMQYTDNV